MSKIKDILLITDTETPFTQTDEAILKEKFDVKKFVISNHSNEKNYKLLFKLFKLIIWSDLLFFWFVSYYKIFRLSKLLNKKTIVVAGGYDVAKEPTIDYGKTLDNKKVEKRIKYILENADKVIPVSNHTKNETLEIANSENIERIYLGIDSEKYKPKQKEKIVITVGGVTNQTIKKKGLETFVKSAKYLPNTKFILIGKHHSEEAIKYLKKISTENVKFTGYIPEKKLLEYMGKAKIYVQVSYHESFGRSLAESMLCGCIPIVTKKGALPEVVGDTGYFVPYGDPKNLSKQIKKALNDNNYKNEGRKRIIRKFNLDNRKKKILRSVDEVS